MSGVRLESVSLGKGFVNWRVVLPPMSRRPRGLEKEYESRVDACQAVKKYFLEDEVDPETVAAITEHAPGGQWGEAKA